MIESASRLKFSESFENHSAQATEIRTTVVIPVYNEEQALPYVLDSIFKVVDKSYEVLVVDDGSRDRTIEIATSYPCRVISHPVNRGKGAALQTGIQQAQGEQVIVIDGDATYPADAIPEVAALLRQYDMVRCVRSNGRDNMPWLNRLGNQVFDQIIKGVYQVDGGDVLSGLYGLQKRHLCAMRLKSDGFDIESEIMIKARAMGLRSHTIPIQYHERIGEKKLAPLKDGLKILGRILSLAVMYNPFVMYIMPGLLLWVLAFVAMALLGHGPLMTPIGGLSTHTLIVSTMSFLTGFQLVVLGCVVNLYAAESGLGQPSRTLSLVAARSPRIGGAFLGVGLVLMGLVWSFTLTWNWSRSGFGPFSQTEMLIIALALVVWGIQLLSTSLFLSLFAGSRKFAPTEQVQQTRNKASLAGIMPANEET